jgi:hypothetical protein
MWRGEARHDVGNPYRTVEHVTIRLIDNSQDTIVDLDYTVFQLDVVPLTDFIRESVFGTDEES